MDVVAEWVKASSPGAVRPGWGSLNPSATIWHQEGHLALHPVAKIPTTATPYVNIRQSCQTLHHKFQQLSRLTSLSHASSSTSRAARETIRLSSYSCPTRSSTPHLENPSAPTLMKARSSWVPYNRADSWHPVRILVKMALRKKEKQSTCGIELFLLSPPPTWDSLLWICHNTISQNYLYTKPITETPNLKMCLLW